MAPHITTHLLGGGLPDKYQTPSSTRMSDEQRIVLVELRPKWMSHAIVETYLE